MKLSSILLPLIAVLAPIKALLIAALALALVDMITGIWAALKRGEKITSAKMRRSVSKIFIYQLGILSGFIIGHLIGFADVPKLVAGIIGIVEARSIFENLDIIYGEPIFKGLIKKLGSKNEE